MQKALQASPVSSGTSEENMQVTGTFSQEVDAAALNKDISEEVEETKNEGTSLTEKMANLALEEGEEESKTSVPKKKAKKKTVAQVAPGKGPVTRSRARL